MAGLTFPAATTAQPSPAIAGGTTAKALVEALSTRAPDLDRYVLGLAVDAARCAVRRGEARFGTLTVIDYSKPSTEPRLWVFDLAGPRLLYRELVSHGVNTGVNEAVSFSNAFGSRMSSLGLMVTADTYQGRNGYSLNLHGLEEGINDHAYERRVVIHGAWYVSPEFLARHGRLGRSWGCPALEQDKAGEVIDRIQGGNPVFIYYPDRAWLAGSAYLNGCSQEPLASATSQDARTPR